MRYAIILAASILILFPALALSATLNVPVQYPTIQDAINTAVNGDTVLVDPGTYVENIDYQGKIITVKSSDGPRATIIDGKAAGTVVFFQNGETPDAILEGFSITNGSGTNYHGGGIYCRYSSSPTIRDNIIIWNQVMGDGGGICCDASSPVITRNLITNNGGFEGSAISCLNSSFPEITYNAICGNRMGVVGSGIHCGYSSPLIANNVISDNVANAVSAISCNHSSPKIVNNNIRGNISIMEVTIFFVRSTVFMSGNTIADNVSSGEGIVIRDFSDVTIMDSVIRDNSLASSSEIHVESTKEPSILTISYSDLAGGMAGVTIEPGCTLNWGAGMIDADPLFAAGPDGFSYLGQVVAGQAADSPCLDAGSDLAKNLGMDIYWTRTDEVVDSGQVDMGFHYGSFTFPPLQAATHWFKEGSGGESSLLLHAGSSNANRSYLLLGSIGGTEPGIPLPGGMAKLPLQWDAFTNLVVLYANTSVFKDFLGALDADGRSTAHLTIGPVPGLAGSIMYFAFALNKPWDFASNPVGIEIVP